MSVPKECGVSGSKNHEIYLGSSLQSIQKRARKTRESTLFLFVQVHTDCLSGVRIMRSEYMGKYRTDELHLRQV